MSSLDLAIVVVSLVGLVVLAAWLARRQAHTRDYYLGGGRLPAWALGLSLAANQVSAISLIGAPAFVALRAGGGLRWLQYELAVPLAMAVLVVWGAPFLRRAAGAEVYEAVEGRLGRGARRVLAAFFLVVFFLTVFLATFFLAFFLATAAAIHSTASSTSSSPTDCRTAGPSARPETDTAASAPASTWLAAPTISGVQRWFTGSRTTSMPGKRSATSSSSLGSAPLKP